MLKFSNKGLLAVALILSLMTSLLVYNYLQKAGEKNITKNGVSVVMAKTAIPAKTKITPEMVETTIVPQEYVQPGAVTNISSAIGIIARENIVPGEQITERRLVRESKAVGFTGLIPRDKRAVSVMVNEVTGVSGFIKPGDYVDVIVTFDQAVVGDNVSHVLLQNILVLAVNREAEEGISAASNKDGAKEAIKATTVTLAVTVDEATKLTLAHEKGKINLALRPYLPLNGIQITNVVTPSDLVGVQYSPVNHQPSSHTESSPPPVYIASEPAKTSPPPANEIGIKVIRGTKVENIPLN